VTSVLLRVKRQRRGRKQRDFQILKYKNLKNLFYTLIILIMFLKMIIKAILYTENLQITERVLYDNLLRKPIQELLNHPSRNQTVVRRTMAVSLAVVSRQEIIRWIFVTSNRYITVKRSSGCSSSFILRVR